MESIMPKLFYDSLDKYVKKILKDIKMSMEIRSISDQLFIEKVKFLKLEERTGNEIYEELLNQKYKLIKIIPCKLTSNSNSLNFNVTNKFIYQVTKETILFYFVWTDNLGNIAKPTKPFEIIHKGDKLSLY
jgi:hypothetical protein